MATTTTTTKPLMSFPDMCQLFEMLTILTRLGVIGDRNWAGCSHLITKKVVVHQ